MQLKTHVVESALLGVMLQVPAFLSVHRVAIEARIVLQASHCLPQNFLALLASGLRTLKYTLLLNARTAIKVLGLTKLGFHYPVRNSVLEEGGRTAQGLNPTWSVRDAVRGASRQQQVLVKFRYQCV